MSLRTHAVVVQPDQWPGAPAELARLLAPITGTGVAPLTEALSRGPMTVEADLSAADARALLARLSSMGVPAEIQPPDAAAPGAIEPDRARVTDEVPRTRRSTMLGGKPMVTGEAIESGWGAVFPDLAATPPRPEPKPPRPAVPATPPSLDELEDAAGPAAPTRRPMMTPPLGQLHAAAAPREMTPPLEREVVGPASPAATPPPTPPVQPRTADTSTSMPAASSKKQPIKPSGFDPSKLSALMPEAEDDAGRPPHKPTGFDPRPEHHPPFAVMFAILAPGAGHVFNGDDDDALSIGLRFWMIKPWIDSVRVAREHAEKIRTHWAPRPPDGSGIRAFKYAFSWWLCVALIVAIAAWGIPALLGLINHKPHVEGITAEQIASTLASAQTGVLGARVKALDALREASADLVAQPKFTMSEEERAERLFAIGYIECERKGYAMCEAMMKRVQELKPAYGPAIKLQAWASVSMNGHRATMPDVGPVQTLSEIELQKMRDEMVIQGERVPPPREPSTNGAIDTPEADAGAVP